MDNIQACNEAELRELEKRANSHKSAKREVERAKIALGLLNGKSQARLARELKLRPNTVNKWATRFKKEGLAGLQDSPRSGRPQSVGQNLRVRIIEMLEKPPPKGQGFLDGISLAKALGVKKTSVYDVLEKEGIQLQRHRSWCVSTDKEFTAKSADVIGLYLNPPERALVICIDEKPTIQGLSRKIGYVETSSGKIVIPNLSFNKTN